MIDNADNIEHWWPGKYKSNASLDDPAKNLSNFLPARSEKGKVLITTRDNRVASRLVVEGKPVTLQPMDCEEAKTLFLSKLGDNESVHQKTDVDSLMQELDNLPLALTQAAAFIQENDISVAEYNDALRSKVASVAEEFLDEELNDARRDEESVNSVFRTWNLSYKQIKEQKPAAADLLCLLAMLDRQSVPKSLLKVPEVTTSLSVLQAFNLVTSRAGLKSFQLHRLVQRFVQLSIRKDNATQKWQTAAVASVSKEYPTEIGVAEWPICDALAPHVHILTTYNLTDERARLDLAHLLCWAADFDIERGMYTQALARAQQSLRIFRDLASERDHGLAAATWLYGRLRYYQARSPSDIDAAIDSLRTALDISECPSLNYAETTFELAHIYFDQGNADKCLEMGSASYKCWEAMRGPNSSRTLDNLQDYALELAMLGREEEGVAAWQEIIDRCPATDASENTKTIYTYRSMAGIAEFQGDAALAEIFYKKLIILCLELYHPEHMHVYDYRLSHVEQIMLQANFEEAMRLSETILEDCTNSSEWRLQVKCLLVIATCHRLSLDFSRELPVRLRTLELHEKHLGEGYKETTDAHNSLADCYLNNAHYTEARDLHERVFAWHHSHQGHTHSDTIRTIECLGVAHTHLGNDAAAEAAYLDALERQSTRRGQNGDHSVVDHRLYDNLQISLWKQGKWEDLEMWSRRSCDMAVAAVNDDNDAAKGRIEAIDKNSNDVYYIRAHQNLIDALERQGKVDEALHVRARLMTMHNDGSKQDGGTGSLKDSSTNLRDLNRQESKVGEEVHRRPTIPPIKHQRRFGRIVHPRTWSE